MHDLTTIKGLRKFAQFASEQLDLTIDISSNQAYHEMYDHIINLKNLSSWLARAKASALVMARKKEMSYIADMPPEIRRLTGGVQQRWIEGNCPDEVGVLSMLEDLQSSVRSSMIALQSILKMEAQQIASGI